MLRANTSLGRFFLSLPSGPADCNSSKLTTCARCERQIVTNVGEDLQKSEASYSAGGNTTEVSVSE